MKLDIGCGVLNDSKKRRYTRYLGSYDPAEYIGVDKIHVPGVDVVCDINKGLPFRDETIDEIICIHVLEHVPDLELVMKEFHRVLKPAGILRIWVPHCFSPIAFGDSTHCRFFTYETFIQFDKRHRASYYYQFHFDFIMSKLQILRRGYKPNFFDKILEGLINLKQRKGERFLKVLPYKDWEVYSVLKKPSE